MRPFVAFDIETAPTARALALEPTEEFLNKGIRENFKPETAMLHREKNEEAWGEEIAKRGALDWRLGRIVAAGTAKSHISGGVPVVHVDISVVAPEDDARQLSHELCRMSLEVEDVTLKARTVPGERQLLVKTWGQLAHPGSEQISGFCVRTFDIPWLMGRTAAQGLTPPRRIQNTRYQHDHVVDWSDLLTWYDCFPRSGWTLTDYADWFDLRYRPWGEGSDIPVWLEEGNYVSIVKHLAFDLLTSHALHERFAPVYLY